MPQTLKMLMSNRYTHTPKPPHNYIHDPDLKKYTLQGPCRYIEYQFGILPAKCMTAKFKSVTEVSSTLGLNHRQLPTKAWYPGYVSHYTSC